MPASHRHTIRPIVRLLVALALLPPGMPWAAAGSGAEDKDLDVERFLRLGPFRVRPYLALKQAGYDNNVFQDSRGEGDYTSTVTPGVKGVVRFRNRAAVLLSEEIDYVAFAHHAELNHLNNAARAKVDLFLGPLLVYADATRQDLSERADTEVDIRARWTQSRQVLGVTGHVSARVGTEVRLAREAIRFGSGLDGDLSSDPERQAQLQALQGLSRVEQSVSVAAGYRLLPKTALGLEGTFVRSDFDDGAAVRDTRRRRLSVEVRMDPTAFLAGHARAGVLRLDPLERADGGFRGVVGEAGLKCRVLGRGQAGVRFARDAVFSILGDNLYYVTTGWEFTYAHRFTHRWEVQLAHGREALDYPAPFAGSGPESGLREDIVTTDSASGIVQLKNRTRIGLRFARWDRHSSFDSAAVSRGTVSTFVEYAY